MLFKTKLLVALFVLSFLWVGGVDAASKKQAKAPLIKEPAAFLIKNLDNGVLIDSKNAHTKRSVASLTKLMAAYVFLTHKDKALKYVSINSYEDVDRIKHTRTSLKTEAMYDVQELFYLSMVNSNNNATFALSRSIQGMSREEFVREMNFSAKYLKMKNSFFREPTGLSGENVSTASDLMKLVEKTYLMPEINEVASVPRVVSLGSEGSARHFKNTNFLVTARKQPLLLSKTGYTREAGFNLVFVTDPSACNGRRYAFVVLGAVNKESRKVFVESKLRELNCLQDGSIRS